MILKWSHHLKGGSQVNVFSRDHRLNPRLPSPTSFDKVEPSFLEWSDEVLALLAVTRYQEFIPLLSAAASSKEVIESDVMFKGVLSDINDEN